MVDGRLVTLARKVRDHRHSLVSGFEAARRLALRQGWRIVVRGGHLKWYPPDPALPMVVTATTRSDRRAWKNARAWLRRSGLEGV